jgi:hypothetical protein
MESSSHCLSLDLTIRAAIVAFSQQEHRASRGVLRADPVPSEDWSLDHPGGTPDQAYFPVWAVRSVDTPDTLRYPGSCQIAFGQLQDEVPGMLDEAPAGLEEPLLVSDQL